MENIFPQHLTPKISQVSKYDIVYMNCILYDCMAILLTVCKLVLNLLETWHRSHDSARPGGTLQLSFLFELWHIGLGHSWSTAFRRGYQWPLLNDVLWYYGLVENTVESLNLWLRWLSLYVWTIGKQYKQCETCCLNGTNKFWHVGAAPVPLQIRLSGDILTMPSRVTQNWNQGSATNKKLLHIHRTPSCFVPFKTSKSSHKRHVHWTVSNMLLHRPRSTNHVFFSRIHAALGLIEAATFRSHRVRDTLASGASVWAYSMVPVISRNSAVENSKQFLNT